MARKVGTTVRYTLSEPATVQFKVQRIVRRRKQPIPVGGSFEHAGGKDSNTLRFTGRIADRKLRPGSYRLIAVPTDAAGNRGAAKSVRFRISRR